MRMGKLYSTCTTHFPFTDMLSVSLATFVVTRLSWSMSERFVSTYKSSLTWRLPTHPRQLSKHHRIEEIAIAKRFYLYFATERARCFFISAGHWSISWFTYAHFRSNRKQLKWPIFPLQYSNVWIPCVFPENANLSRSSRPGTLGRGLLVCLTKRKNLSIQWLPSQLLGCHLVCRSSSVL